ncbi:hypothetical protein RBB78_24040 [Tunturiibacter empetritectus]|uniref:hypothetical protein n=1 Tax=Tunturiibacter empetritectus TaxID=3069691 RepID=UPI003D9BA5A7
MKDKLTIVTGPDKGDRLKQFLYTQLPYHPQRIEKKTAWTVETSEPLSLSQTVVDTVAKAQPVAVPLRRQRRTAKRGSSRLILAKH